MCAGVAGVFACLVEVSANRAPWQLLILFWNVGLRVAAFCAIGWLAARVSILTRGLEQTVEQRTTRLESEVEKHKETSELLGEAIQLFKQVTENITDVFWVTDAAKSRVEYVSPAFEWLWGKSCESLQMSPSVWFESIHHEDRERVIRAMLTKQTTGEYDEEYRVVHPDGALRWVHDRAFRSRTPRARFTGLSGLRRTSPSASAPSICCACNGILAWCSVRPATCAMLWNGCWTWRCNWRELIAAASTCSSPRLGNCIWRRTGFVRLLHQPHFPVSG